MSFVALKPNYSRMLITLTALLTHAANLRLKKIYRNDSYKWLPKITLHHKGLIVGLRVDFSWVQLTMLLMICMWTKFPYPNSLPQPLFLFNFFTISGYSSWFLRSKASAAISSSDLHLEGMSSSSRSCFCNCGMN